MHHAPPIPLLPGERILYVGRRSWRAVFKWLVLGALTIWIFGLGLIFITKAVFDVKGSLYVITSRRIYARYGVVRKYIKNFRIEHGMDVDVYQSFMGGLLGYGDVGASNPGRYGVIVLKGVRDPESVAQIMFEAIKIGEMETTREKARIAADEITSREEKTVTRASTIVAGEVI